MQNWHIFCIIFFVGTKDNGQAGSGGEEDGSGTPPIPPRRKDKRRHNTPPRPQSNGLPPTPKVHMGACFSKVELPTLYFSATYSSFPAFIIFIGINELTVLVMKRYYMKN